MNKFEQFYDPHYEQISRLKHAVVSSRGTTAKKALFSKTVVFSGPGDRQFKQDVTLKECSCGDFKKRGKPCTHMMMLAICEGAFDDKHSTVSKVRGLSDKAYEFLELEFWYGYYEILHEPKRFLSKFTLKMLREIEDQGLIELHGDKTHLAGFQGYTYSKYAQENLAQLTYAIYSDPRNKRS